MKHPRGEHHLLGKLLWKVGFILAEQRVLRWKSRFSIRVGYDKYKPEKSGLYLKRLIGLREKRVLYGTTENTYHTIFRRQLTDRKGVPGIS